MKEAIKMYHLFFPRKWLAWCTYILYPMIALGIGMLFGRVGFYLHATMIFVIWFVVMVESCLDMVVFRGIGAKDCNTLEFIKSSSKGMDLIRRSLRFDGIRRILSILLIMLGMWPINLWHQQYAIEQEWQMPSIEVNDVMIYLQCALIIFIVKELGFLITRRNGNMLINMLIMYLESGIAVFAFVLLMGGAFWMVSILLAVIAILVAVAERKMVIQRVREGYYDERNKKTI